jgi:hypothetical protein
MGLSVYQDISRTPESFVAGGDWTNGTVSSGILARYGGDSVYVVDIQSGLREEVGKCMLPFIYASLNTTVIVRLRGSRDTIAAVCRDFSGSGRTVRLYVWAEYDSWIESLVVVHGQMSTVRVSISHGAVDVRENWSLGPGEESRVEALYYLLAGIGPLSGDTVEELCSCACQLLDDTKTTAHTRLSYSEFSSVLDGILLVDLILTPSTRLLDALELVASATTYTTRMLQFPIDIDITPARVRLVSRNLGRVIDQRALSTAVAMHFSR